MAALASMTACAPTVKIGEWTCAEDGTPTVIPPIDAGIDVGWKATFENRLCDYEALNGYCYPSEPSFELVTTPVHEGKFAMAFHVQSDDPTADQSRCVRQGALPEAAYYGAWYYLPEASVNTSNWNLLHWETGTITNVDGTLDLSLVNANGGLQVAVFDMNYKRVGSPKANAVMVPIGSWFRVQLYLNRSANGPGEISLSLDGQEIFDERNLTTEKPNSNFGRWYVGNLANALTPAASTVYVDDITISDTL
ncbi:MAG: heparin lyase I family protein [Polyangiaceae bacterium]